MKEFEAMINITAVAVVQEGIKPYVTNVGTTGFVLPSGRILRPFLVFEVTDPGEEPYDISTYEAAHLGVQVMDYKTIEVELEDEAVK